MSTLAPYVRGADAVLLVFDITSLESIKDLEHRFSSLLPAMRVASPPVVFLLANKVDRVNGNRGGGEEEGAGDDSEEEKVPEVDQTSVQETLDVVLKSIRARTKAVLADCEGPMADGLLSCYTLSAKTGHNCKEVVEQLQLRIAYRQLHLAHVQPMAGAKEGVDLRARRASLSGRNRPCCIK
jgi:hypothetical protein